MLAPLPDLPYNRVQVSFCTQQPSPFTEFKQASTANGQRCRQNSYREETINEAVARYRHLLYLIILLVLVGAVGYGLTHRPPPLVLRVFPPQPTPLPAPVPTPRSISCHVIGAVNVPGVYTLPAGSRVQNAIQAAGGPTADADLEGLNLAAVVQDQTQVVVPRQVTAHTPEASNPFEGPGTGPVNINTADQETLQTLPGIGPVLAGRIVEYREEHGPFATAADLTAVKGIGEATLEKLRPLITLGP